MYTVKRLSALAGVTVRTLHYYHEIGLLSPTHITPNGYRYYDDAALLRLQQILFYRELDLELLEIKEILDSPSFDTVAALHSHRHILAQKINRLQNLIATVDQTIAHLSGEADMTQKQLFAAFSDERQKEYERQLRLQYDPQLVNNSIQRWTNYSQDQQNAILRDAEEIYRTIAAALDAGDAPTSPHTQNLLERWHANLQHFYEPTLDILRGLGEMYQTHPDFKATMQHIHPKLPDYLQTAISHYIDELEYVEIARLIAEDEHQHDADHD